MKPTELLFKSKGLDRSLVFQFVYLQFVVFIFSGCVKFIMPEGMLARPLFLFSLGLIAFYFPYLIVVITDFFAKADWKLALVALYFFLHPLIVLLLASLELREFPNGMEAIDCLLGAFTWCTHGVIALVILMRFERQDFEKLMRIICVSGFLLTLEAAVAFYIFRGRSFFAYSVNTDGRFGSVFVQSNFIIGYIAILYYTFSIYFIAFDKVRLKYIVGLVMAILLLISSLERSILLSFLFMNFGIAVLFIMHGWRRVVPVTKLVISIFLIVSTLVLITVLYFMLTSLREGATSSFVQLFDRLMMWLRGVDITTHFFPVGAGGNLSGRYVSESSVPRHTSLWIGKYLHNEQYVTVFRVTSGYFQKVGLRRSLHNTHLEYFAEFGLLGMIYTLYNFVYPIVLLIKLYKPLTQSLRKDLFGIAVFAMGLFCLQIAMSMVSAGSYLLWIMIALYGYSYKHHYTPLKRGEF